MLRTCSSSRSLGWAESADLWLGWYYGKPFLQPDQTKPAHVNVTRLCSFSSSAPSTSYWTPKTHITIILSPATHPRMPQSITSSWCWTRLVPPPPISFTPIKHICTLLSTHTSPSSETNFFTGLRKGLEVLLHLGVGLAQFSKHPPPHQTHISSSFPAGHTPSSLDSE